MALIGVFERFGGTLLEVRHERLPLTAREKREFLVRPLDDVNVARSAKTIAEQLRAGHIPADSRGFLDDQFRPLLALALDEQRYSRHDTERDDFEKQRLTTSESRVVAVTWGAGRDAHIGTAATVSRSYVIELQTDRLRQTSDRRSIGARAMGVASSWFGGATT